MPIARETRREAEVLDGFAECMGHEYRRKILFTLYEQDSAERLLVPEDLLDEDLDRETFLVALTHHHLPKLEEWGYIKWDEDAGVVEEGEKFDQMEPLLGVLTEHYDRIVPFFDRNQKA